MSFEDFWTLGGFGNGHIWDTKSIAKRAWDIQQKKINKLVEFISEIGSGPGYPLDDCPKCSAAKRCRDFIKELELE